MKTREATRLIGHTPIGRGFGLPRKAERLHETTRCETVSRALWGGLPRVVSRSPDRPTFGGKVNQ